MHWDVQLNKIKKIIKIIKSKESNKKGTQNVIFVRSTLKGSSSPFRKVDNWTHVDKSGAAGAVTNTQWKVITVL